MFSVKKQTKLFTLSVITSQSIYCKALQRFWLWWS